MIYTWDIQEHPVDIDGYLEYDSYDILSHTVNINTIQIFLIKFKVLIQMLSWKGVILRLQMEPNVTVLKSTGNCLA